MMSNREQRLLDTIRAAARDLQQPDDPYAYHFSSDTYEEETLQLIDEQKLQQQEDSSTYHILGKSEVEQAQIDTAAAAAAANGEISAKAEKQEADVIVVRVGSKPDDRQSKSSSNAEMDNINGEMDDIQTEESPSHRAVDNPVDISTKKDVETHVATSRSGSAHEVKTNDHPAATKVIHQGQEEMMTNLIDAGKIGGTSTANGPFGLPVYAWGIIGVAAGLAIVVVGAMIVKRRGRKSKTKRSRECDDESATKQHCRTGTKKRVAIDYGGEGDDVDVEELSVVSNISSLSGGTFVVRHDRV